MAHLRVCGSPLPCWVGFIFPALYLRKVLRLLPGRPSECSGSDWLIPIWLLKEARFVLGSFWVEALTDWSKLIILSFINNLKISKIVPQNAMYILKKSHNIGSWRLYSQVIILCFCFLKNKKMMWNRKALSNISYISQCVCYPVGVMWFALACWAVQGSRRSHCQVEAVRKPCLMNQPLIIPWEGWALQHFRLWVILERSALSMLDM